MIVALAYSYPDQERASDLLAWIRSLGPYPNHILVLGLEKKVTLSPVADCMGCFADVIEFSFVDNVEHYPESKNLAFQQSVLYIQQVASPDAVTFLYLEVDAVPLVKGWLDAIQADVIAGQRRFCGALVPAVPTHRTPAHMSAVGVYPVDMIGNGAGEAMIATEQPFPAAIASVTTGKMTVSKLFCDDWEGKGVPKGCVLYHPDREGTVLEALREGSEVAERTSEHPHSVAEASPDLGLSSEDHAGSNPAPSVDSISFPGSTDPMPLIEVVHNYSGKAFIGGAPWEDRLQSEETIKFLANELKKYCTKPAYTGYVRKVLRAIKVAK